MTFLGEFMRVREDEASDYESQGWRFSHGWFDCASIGGRWAWFVSEAYHERILDAIVFCDEHHGAEACECVGHIFTAIDRPGNSG